ncbi:MAG: SDR family NAD(P)-dependent oxidoreductase [Holophagales bacterium]|nr:SDR family NAD(P)-dependent oxidoreductase [Holophagales bacterium]
MLIAERTQLPPETLSADARLLSDLHLSSIAVGELVTRAAQLLGVRPPSAPTEYSDASIAELAESLAGKAAAGEALRPYAEGPPEGVESWVRPFVESWQPRSRDPSPEAEGHVRWQIVAPEGHPLAECLARNLADATVTGHAGLDPGVAESGMRTGTILWLGADLFEQDPSGSDGLDRLLRTCQEVLRRDPAEAGPLVVVEIEGGLGGGAFAKTLHLEAPRIPVTVIRIPWPSRPRTEAIDGAPADARIARAIAAEAEHSARSGGYAEARLSPDSPECSERRVPVWSLLPTGAGDAAPETGAPTPSLAPGSPAPLAPGEVVLVTGGGKGIGSECALALARELGVRLAILGRSSPEDDGELAANLKRLEAHAIEYHYLRADIEDPAALAVELEVAQAALGPIRGLVHSAGTNEPALIPRLDRTHLERTLGPKVTGLGHLLELLPATRLRLLVAFGSILGRTGLRGEADYALANEILRHRLERFAEQHPECRTLCLEWSVWSGVGMGARLADLEALARQGIEAISIEAGVAAFLSLLRRQTPVSLIATGRFGDRPTLELRRPELPLTAKPRPHWRQNRTPLQQKQHQPLP